MNGFVHKLPIVILDVYSRCNCRCTMCDIWKQVDTRHMTAAFVRSQLDDFSRLGVEWVVLTGGEPLMNPELFDIATLLRSRRIRVTMLTSGILLRKHAPEIAGIINDVIVSIDGPGEVHDRIRGITGAFARMREGVDTLRDIDRMYRVTGRCTVQRANHDRLCDTVATAGTLGLHSISFLAVDVKSTAFNRSPGWSEARGQQVILDPVQIATLEREVGELIARRPGLLDDSDDHLRRIIDIFRVYAGLGEPRAPRCNAPWVSAVVESSGGVRPCFFHEPFSGTCSSGGFARAVNSEQAVAFRNSLDVEANEICKSCVCSLFRA